MKSSEKATTSGKKTAAATQAAPIVQAAPAPAPAKGVAAALTRTPPTPAGAVSTVQAPAAEVRQQALASMPKALQSVAQVVDGMTAKINTAEVQTRYDIGVQAALVLADPGKYGPDAIEQLAAYVGLDGSQLAQARQVVSAWPDRRVFAEITTKKLVDGRPLTWAHMRALARVEDPAKRQALLAKTLSEALSSHALMAEIGAKALMAPDTRVPSPGRPTQSSPNFQIACKRGLQVLGRITKYLTVDQKLVTELAPKERTPEAYKRLTALQTAVQTVTGELAALERSLQSLTGDLEAELGTGKRGKSKGKVKGKGGKDKGKAALTAELQEADDDFQPDPEDADAAGIPLDDNEAGVDELDAAEAQLDDEHPEESPE